MKLFLCGDVMLGRGVDQILPHPGDPELRESHVRDARHYVAAAEARNGPIRSPVGHAWPWGSALRVVEEAAPDVRVVNLETSITHDGRFAADKGVHYRMSPSNVDCVRAGRPDVCTLANNHVLDFGRRGLVDTLEALSAAGLRWAGAGRDAAEAHRPALVETPRGRVAVFGCGAESSGIPPSWAATAHRPGVRFLPDLSDRCADELVAEVREHTRPGDVVVVSVHWGSNWQYRVPPEQVRFAHRLVDGGVHVVHGHSSHHPRPIEVHHGRLVLYGCGDFIDDYEGIPGYERYRDDLRLLHFASLTPTGELADLRMVPMQARRMRLHPASPTDTRWLHDTLSRISAGFGTEITLTNGDLHAHHR
ncbi:CapA family protein [Saccharopolyspora hordei]|uniref:Poly-gamma-glutamate synthesis protein (Capsule biosynthesis protein) n=1 Tax=Saccharopolyspora hordei TaxID=1838 RepID=A0A853AK08_9PSEU|nr:CapA family protein [Saccharopolyspora hordei]NYI85014.1 poly-gamma-glutamate synthesis protein (capsule biosynthesis protein) [Saccharopolyspora hordei]